MTVCIATVCRFNYRKADDQKDDFGWVILTASDRMLTDEGLGIQYETGQGKWAKIADRVVVLAADSIAVHSDVLYDIRKDPSHNNDVGPKQIADLYSKFINKRRERDAEKEFLSPFGLTMAEFIAKQKDMERGVVNALCENIANYKINVEALVVGCDKDGVANIYSVDSTGLVSCHTDIGFAAIGIGSVHSVPFLMSHSYWNGWAYYPALLATFAAKKAAEIAPGVGKHTDMGFISRDGAFTLYEGARIALEPDPKRVE